MNKETIKTFILSVLVGLSFLLSYILWSYQPKYDMFYNTSYVNEVDVGGSERIKSDLSKPKDIIFHRENSVLGFKQLKDQEALYKDMIEWEFGEFNSDEHIENLDGKDYVEVIFPHAISVELLAHLAHYDDTEQFPNWTFERFYFVLSEN